MSVFLSNAETRLVLDNCPIRVIFNQRLNIHDIKDPAFQHFHDEHLKIISSLQRGCFLLDITEQGIWFLYARPSPAEMRRFGAT